MVFVNHFDHYPADLVRIGYRAEPCPDGDGWDMYNDPPRDLLSLFADGLDAVPPEVEGDLGHERN